MNKKNNFNKNNFRKYLFILILAVLTVATGLVSYFIVNSRYQEKKSIKIGEDTTTYPGIFGIPRQIDTKVVRSGNTYKNTTNLFKTYFKKDPTANGAVVFKNGKSEISFYSPADQTFGVLNPGTPQNEGNTISYNNIFTGLDLRYTISSTRLLEEFIVSDKNTAYKVTEIKQIAKLKNIDRYVQKDGRIDFYFQEKVVYSLPKPVIYELNNKESKSYGIKYNVLKNSEDELTITKVITQSGIDWLTDQNRNYPVAIDLVIDNADTYTDWVSSDSSVLSVSQETTIKQEGTGSVKLTTPSWYNASWPYRLKLTIESDNVGADLTDFPVYLDLNDLPAAFHSHVNQTDARDIRITKSDGVSELPREVVYYTAASDTGEVHFKYTGTLSSSTDTDIYLYYGNAGASDYATDATYGAENVWDSYYVAVFHLQESGNGTTDEYVDSTSHGFHGTGGSGAYPSQTTGNIGNGQSFDGTNDIISVGSDISGVLDLISTDPPSYNTSGWFYKSDTAGGDLGGIKLITSNQARLLYRTSLQVYSQLVGSSTSVIQSSVATGSWHYISASYNQTGTSIGLTVDTTVSTPATAAITDLTGYTMGIVLGNAQNYYKGLMDEVRVSTIVRASTWNSTEYNNQNSPGTFFNSFGTEETITGQNATLTKTSTDLSGYDQITFWVRSDRTGQFTRFQFGESASSEQTYDITINSVDTWEQKTWDISAISSASRDGVTKFAFEITDASSSFTYYFDDIQASVANTAPGPPTTLWAEGSSNPTGVADPTPEFSAIYNDSDSGDIANKYQIQVDDDSGFGSTIWDSGSSGTSMSNCTEGNRCSDISYAGSALSWGTTYYWRIKYWDDSGSEGDWSTGTNTFAMNFVSNTPSLDSPADTGTNQSLTPSLLTTSTDTESDYLRYKITVCEDSGMSVNCQTFDQTSTQTGWSGQDAQTGSAYASGTQATYTVQSALDPATTYYWKSYSIDPAGTNTWSSTQGTPYSFTTTDAPSSPSTPYAEGATNPSGVADTTPEFSAVHVDINGDSANYYQINVDTQVGFDGVQMWDSGQQSMTTTANGVRSPDISYAGSSLSLDGSTYYWRIKFWDVNGAEGSWSATQNFTMNSGPAIPSLDSPADTAVNRSTTPALLTTSTDPDSDYLRYKITICEDSGMSVNCQTFDQTLDQTGWSGQDAQTGSAYASGTQATYTVQSALDNNKTYYWKSYTIDPAGTNVWSSTQTTPYSFTTISPPGNFDFKGVDLKGLNLQ